MEGDDTAVATLPLSSPFSLPSDLIFGVELFLPIRSVAALSAVGRGPAGRASQRHWQRLFIARWGDQYADGEGGAALRGTRVSARIVGGLASPSRWRFFWSTVERAFIGYGTVLPPRPPPAAAAAAGTAAGAGTAAAAATCRRGRPLRAWLLRLFRLMQPPPAHGSRGDRSGSAYRAFQGQPGAPGAGAAAAPSAPWHLACLLREVQNADVVLCFCCDEMDVLTTEMRDWEALPTQCSSFVSPCGCALIAHRRCLERRLLYGYGGGSGGGGSCDGDCRCCDDVDGGGGYGSRSRNGSAASEGSKGGGGSGGGGSNGGGGGGGGSDGSGAGSPAGARLNAAAGRGVAAGLAGDDDAPPPLHVPTFRRWLQQARRLLPSAPPKNWISFDDTEHPGIQQFLDPTAGVDIADFVAATGLGFPATAAAVASAMTGGGNGGGNGGGGGEVVDPAATVRYRCRKCGCRYTLGWRLPGSMGELVRVTCCDAAAWQRLFAVFFNWLALVATVQALERWQQPAATAAAMAAGAAAAGAAGAAGAAAAGALAAAGAGAAGAFAAAGAAAGSLLPTAVSCANDSGGEGFGSSPLWAACGSATAALATVGCDAADISYGAVGFGGGSAECCGSGDVSSDGYGGGCDGGYGAGYGSAWPEPGGLWLLWWLLQQVVLLHVFYSPRFMHVVAQLWRGPIFAFYCRLYLYFAAACIIFVLTWTPLLPRAFPARFNCGGNICGGGDLFAATGGGYGSCSSGGDHGSSCGCGGGGGGRCNGCCSARPARLPPWLTAVGWANAVVYAVVSSIVIFLFWKTQYRLATVADGRRSCATTHPILHLRTAV